MRNYRCINDQNQATSQILKNVFSSPRYRYLFQAPNSKKTMRYPNTRYGNPTEFQYFAQGQSPKDIAKRLRRSEILRLQRTVSKKDLQIELGSNRTDLTLMKWMIGLIIAGVAALVLKSFF